MRLYHYTAQPFVFDPLRTYEQHNIVKPVGLWVSCEDDWPRWCREEDFYVGGLAHRTEIIVRTDANILRIGSADELRAFTERFGDQFSIEWRNVVASYQGILIAPYFWECRFSHTWYYPWDCASGCIWDLSAISTVVECHEEKKT